MHKGMVGKVGPASVDLTLADYIHRKNVAAAFDAVNAEKAECCGNPLRGCKDCPPPKKLSSDDWYTKEDVESLLLTLRIAHEGYPPSEARYASIQDFLKEYNALCVL